MDELGFGLVGAAILYGFRHGFDLDHLAAIGDIAASSGSRRRSIALSSFYIGGHAAVVLALGAAAVAVGVQIPSGLDDVMGRVVGVTLIILGVVVGYRALRGDTRLRSRWMLAAEGVHAVARRIQVSREVVIIEHSHDHDHEGTHAHSHDAVSDSGPQTASVATLATKHAHTHRHVAALPPDPFARYTSTGATALGVVHGVGAETPTQILLFSSAAGAATVVGGITVLIAFVVGLVIANGVVAVTAALGVATPVRWPRTFRIVTAVAAATSLLLGIVYALGLEPATFLNG